MRYLVLLGLSLLMLGCEEEPPIYNGKPRTQDLIAVGVEETENGEVWVLCQEVSRWKEGADPIHLDTSPIYDPPYYFNSQTLKLQAGGRHFQSVGGGNYEYGLVYYFDRVADGFLQAGVNFGSCFNHSEVVLPTITVRDGQYQEILVRFAQLSCDYSYAFYQNWDEMHIYPMHVVKLANGNLLYWGLGSTGSARLTCVTEYGEVMWSQLFDSQELHWTSVVSLRNGGFAMVEQYSEIVRFYDNNGVHGHDIEFNRTDEYRVTSIAQLGNGNFIAGGVNMTSNDPHLWYYTASGTEERDTTLYVEGCQDSVVLYPAGENILVAASNGTICSETDPVRLMLIDSAFNVIGVESFGGSAHVVLKDITIADDGSIYLCGAFDRGIGSYSALITKFDANLNAVWSTMVHPNM
ncbi:hypothetical protein HUU59_10285 [bacterium]|nr:hypothetical protein [bacterium]